MVAASQRLDNSYAMKEYQNPRFDGKLTGLKLSPAKKTDWNRAKGDFIEFYIKKKAQVPPPCVYEAV